VLMPAVAAGTAFLLCRYITHALWPSLVGGYLFGFSAYMLERASVGHINLTSVFLLPLVALLILRFLDGELGGRSLTIRLGPILALQLLLSTEVAFTLTLAIVVGLLLCLAAVPTRRRGIVSLLPNLLGAYLLAGLLVAPFLYYLVTGFQKRDFSGATGNTADLVNFVVPPNYVAAAGEATSRLSRSFPNIVVGQESYLGLPALLIVGLFFWGRTRTETGRFLLACLAAVLALALGAHATVFGHRIVTFPWALVQGLPLFDNAQTVRLAAYTTLVAAVIVALWTATRRSGWLRWLLPALAVLAIVPNPTSDNWTAGYLLPAFFTGSAYRDCLDPGERILVLPIGQGSAMLWQAESDFRFNMAGGYVGPYIPQSFLHPASMYYVTVGNHLEPGQTNIVRAFIATKHLTSVVVAQFEDRFFTALNNLAKSQTLGGVDLYHFGKAPPSCTGP
jgi:hypothetical protein